jgi:hypothetical protein
MIRVRVGGGVRLANECRASGRIGVPTEFPAGNGYLGSSAGSEIIVFEPPIRAICLVGVSAKNGQVVWEKSSNL